MKRFVIFMLPLGLIMNGCAGSVPQQKDDAFSYSVEAVRGSSYLKGARSAWNYLDAADKDDPRYDRGLRLLAESLEGLELNWGASMLFRQIAQARRNVELVPSALRGLERIVRSEVYDDDSTITSFIAAEEFSDLPEDLEAFVNYHQGLDLARRGIDKWADQRFEKIPFGNDYYLAFEYVYAVRHVVEGDYEKALESLEALKVEIEKRFASMEKSNTRVVYIQDEEGKTIAVEETENLIIDSVRRDVERSLARIAFEEQRYEDALVHYDSLRELAPNDPEILLESAWTHFYLGDSRKALGLLIALDAPVHDTYIAPERYLLEALSLRRLCQFAAARQAAVRLERRHGKEIKAIADGHLPKNIPGLRMAARQRGLSRHNYKFKLSLQHEMILLESLADKFGPRLAEFLQGLYKSGLDEANRREEQLLDDDIHGLSEELLAAREGVRLIVHELGVSLLRGRRRPGGAPEKPEVEVPISGERAFFPFRGEFWTDELDDLIVKAEDRCID